MQIEMAKNSGFCMGVRKAILRIVDEINKSDEKIFVYGPLIHNPQTLDALEKRGVQTIHSLDEIDSKDIAIRTHGIPVEEYKQVRERAKRSINLTCSRVARVQGLIKKYSSDGYYTIIIGDKDHAEVTGLQSYATVGHTIISSVKDITSIPLKYNKYLLVSQTTLDRKLFREIEDSLVKRIDNLKVIDTICDSTRYRQQDVINGIEKGINTLVVVGGRNSANTKRLAKIGSENSVKTFLIETEDELIADEFSDEDNILVTAGASTPGWIINNVLEKLYNIKFKKQGLLTNCIKNLLEFIVRTNILAGIAACFLSLFAQQFLRIPVNIPLAIVSFLYIFSMYSINNYFDKDILKINNPYKYAIYNKFGKVLLNISIISMAISLAILLHVDLWGFLIILPAYLFGFSYSTKPMKKFINSMKSHPINRIYSSKIVTTIGWLHVTLFLPMVIYKVLNPIAALISIYIFAFVLLRHLLIDLIAFQGDLILGKGTIPIWMGLTKTRRLYFIITAVSALLFISGCIFSGQYIFSLVVLNLVYFAFLMEKIIKQDYLISVKYELLVDSNFLLFILLFIVTQL